MAKIVIDFFNSVFTSKLLNLDLVKSVFKFKDDSASGRTNTWLDQAGEFQLNFCQSLKYGCFFRCSKPTDKVQKMLRKGTKKIESMLDVRSII